MQLAIWKGATTRFIKPRNSMRRRRWSATQRPLARPAGCWAPKDAKVALEQTSGRQRLNIHGAIDLETGATRMIEATTIDALARPGCRIRVHYIPSYCPHLDPIERLWGLMHRHVTHNRCYATYNDFCRAVLHFLREEVPKNWAMLCDSVTDNFRIINPADFRVLTA